MKHYLFPLLLGVLLIACTEKKEQAKLTFLIKGNEAFEKDNLEKANFFYKEAIKTDSTYVDAYLNNALVLEAKGELYGAIEMYDALLLLNPLNEDALYKRANLYLDVDQYYRALDDLKGLDKSWQDSAKLYFLKGLVNTKLKRNEIAIQEFEKSLKIDKNQAQAYINIGNVYYYKNDLTSASTYVLKGLEIDPDVANGLNTLGLISAKKSRYDEAIDFFNKALHKDPNNAWYINNKGFAYLQMNKLDSASYLMNESMKIDPYNAWVYRNKGLLELVQQHNAQGLAHLQKAYKMDKTIDHINADLARAYALNGKNEEACGLAKSEQNEKTRAELVSTYCL